MKEFIINLAKEAGEMAMSYQGKVKISSKGVKNIVTEADIAIEKMLISKIKKEFPDHKIFAEETNKDNIDSKHVWYIDPIDGTTNYAHGDPHFAISIALAEDGDAKYACIYLPRFNEMYYAERGHGTELNGNIIHVSDITELKNALIQAGISPLKHAIDKSWAVFRLYMTYAERARDYAFCAGQLAFVASGKADALVKRSQHPWDVAAGVLLIEEAGGKVTDESGNKIKMNKDRFNIIASNGHIHDELMEKYNTIKIEPENWYN